MSITRIIGTPETSAVLRIFTKDYNNVLMVVHSGYAASNNTNEILLEINDVDDLYEFELDDFLTYDAVGFDLFLNGPDFLQLKRFVKSNISNANIYITCRGAVEPNQVMIDRDGEIEAVDIDKL